MPRSAFLELLDEEAGIARGGRGKFATFDDLKRMLDGRVALIKKIEAAKKQGELTTQ